MLSNDSSLRKAGCRIGFLHKVSVIAVVLSVFVICPSIGHADYQLGTRDGKTLIWDQFTLEDGNYCTWKKGGKFCLPQSDVVSLKEVSGGGDSSDGPRQAYGSSSGRDSGSGQSDRGSSVGVMNRSYNSVSGDGRGYSGRGRGGSFDVDHSSTSYSKEVTDADIRQIELDAYSRKQAADERRIEDERREQAARALEEDRQARLRQERERDKQKYEADRNTYRPFRRY